MKIFWTASPCWSIRARTIPRCRRRWPLASRFCKTWSRVWERLRISGAGSRPDSTRETICLPVYGGIFEKTDCMDTINDSLRGQIEALDRAIGREPDNGSLYVERGKCYHKAGIFDRALNDFSFVPANSLSGPDPENGRIYRSAARDFRVPIYRFVQSLTRLRLSGAPAGNLVPTLPVAQSRVSPGTGAGPVPVYTGGGCGRRRCATGPERREHKV